MISLPSTFKIIPSSKVPNSAKVEISPLYPGYGHTVGNALRRVLLSSLEGAGVTAVKLDGADHEFMNLPHIKEEVLEIILNLKQLSLKMHGDDKEKIILEVKGKKNVTAADFKSNPNVEIANKDLHIASLNHKDATLYIEATVTKGLGFSPVEDREKELEVGIISIDTLFSPVQSVGYSVENTRVGKRTDYDKLIMRISTDGTISIDEAMAKASQILVEQFQIINQEMTAKGTLSVPKGESVSGGKEEDSKKTKSKKKKPKKISKK